MKRCRHCDTTFDSPDWVCPGCGAKPAMADQVVSFAPDLAQQSDGYNPSRYETISRFERQHFWFRGRNELICGQLRKYFPKATDLLEIGCGTGQVLSAIVQAFPALRLWGTEIYSSGLVYARQSLPGAELFQMDARAIPFRDHFDVIRAFDVIEDIDDVGVLWQMYQACKSGGGIMITVPQHRWLWSYKDEAAHHKRRYIRAELYEKVEAAGFRIVKTSSFVSLLLPLMYLSRRQQQNAKDADLQSEYRISPLMNRFFLACSRMENSFIRFGGNLPIGGSLLVIATVRLNEGSNRQAP